MRLYGDGKQTYWLQPQPVIDLTPEHTGLFSQRLQELVERGEQPTKAWLRKLPPEERKAFSALGLAKIRELYGNEVDLATGKTTSRFHRAGGEARAATAIRKRGRFMKEGTSG